MRWNATVMRSIPIGCRLRLHSVESSAIEGIHEKGTEGPERTGHMNDSQGANKCVPLGHQLVCSGCFGLVEEHREIADGGHLVCSLGRRVVGRAFEYMLHGLCW
jgi:hypothetical protein